MLPTKGPDSYGYGTYTYGVPTTSTRRSIRRDPRPTSGQPRMSFTILAVCSGNICRSPFAEQLLRSVSPASTASPSACGHDRHGRRRHAPRGGDALGSPRCDGCVGARRPATRRAAHPRSRSRARSQRGSTLSGRGAGARRDAPHVHPARVRAPRGFRLRRRPRRCRITVRRRQRCHSPSRRSRRNRFAAWRRQPVASPGGAHVVDPYRRPRVTMRRRRSWCPPCSRRSHSSRAQRSGHRGGTWQRTTTRRAPARAGGPSPVSALLAVVVGTLSFLALTENRSIPEAGATPGAQPRADRGPGRAVYPPSRGRPRPPRRRGGTEPRDRRDRRDSAVRAVGDGVPDALDDRDDGSTLARPGSRSRPPAVATVQRIPPTPMHSSH